jgi:hypothetical protein
MTSLANTGFPDTEFSDIYGSMTKDGVPKPVWRAFQLMHTHAGDLAANTTIFQHQSNPTPSASSVAGAGAGVAVAGAADAVAAPMDACGLVPKTDFLGGDILPDSQHLIKESAADCCMACQQHTGTSPDTKCQMWSWGNANSSCCAKRCYLKQLGGREVR